MGAGEQSRDPTLDHTASLSPAQPQHRPSRGHALGLLTSPGCPCPQEVAAAHRVPVLGWDTSPRPPFGGPPLPGGDGQRVQQGLKGTAQPGRPVPCPRQQEGSAQPLGKGSFARPASPHSVSAIAPVLLPAAQQRHWRSSREHRSGPSQMAVLRE